MSNGLAIVSLHDVSPAAEHHVADILTTLDRWGLPAPSLLVVPDHHGRHLLDQSPSFVRLIEKAKNSGSEVLLHGFFHRASRQELSGQALFDRVKARLLTSGEGEFQNLAFPEAVRRLTRGREIVESTCGFRISGFVAPAWLEHRDTARALQKTDFSFHEDQLFIRDLRSGFKYLCPAVTFSSRSPARIAASWVWARLVTRLARGTIPLRLALHPLDFQSTRLKEAIHGFIRAASTHRRFVSYADFLARCN